MSDALVGVTSTRAFYAEQSGLPLRGLASTLVYSLWSPTGTLLLDAVPTTDNDTGWYTVLVDGSDTLTSQGLYRERWADATLDLLYETAFLVVTPGRLLVTRRELRQQIALLCDDLILGRVEAATDTSVYDTDRIETLGEFRGSWLYIYGGVGAFQERRVSGGDAGVLTLGRPWATVPIPNDKYELHRRYSVDSYHAAIDLVIQQVTLSSLIPISDESIVLTSALEYNAPAGLYCVSQVWTGTGDSWTLLAPKTDWDTLPGRRLIRLKTPTAGQRLRLLGQLYPSRLWQDDSYCDVRPDYVTFKAAAHLLSSAGAGPQLDAEQRLSKANAYHQQAERLKPTEKPLVGARRL